jgi:hypothetical protein
MSDAKNDLRVDRYNKIMTVSWLASNIKQMRCFFSILVELTGIEPVTSCLQSRRSPN